MNQDFWNNRYSELGIAYGIEPNEVLKSNVTVFNPNSKILCLAEGEGRNAIYLAKLGHEVTAVDFSEQGIRNMNRLAKENNIKITTICSDLHDFKVEENSWDGIVVIFGHFPATLRSKLFSSFYQGLKKEGTILIVGYHKKQLGKNSGGPTEAELLYGENELTDDFNSFDEIQMNQFNIHLSEGKYHQGLSSLLVVKGKK